MTIKLFNPLNWQRKGFVSLANASLPRGEFELIDATTGEAVVYERRRNHLEFVTPLVPACSYLILNVKPVVRRTQPGLHAEWQQSNLTLHTAEYSLQFHSAGGMCRWHDRGRSSQWCSNEVDFPMGAYLYKTARANAKYRSNGSAVVRHEIAPLCSRVFVEAKQYRTTFALYRGLRDLHVSVELLGQRGARLGPRGLSNKQKVGAGYAFFPFAGDEPKVLVDRGDSQIDLVEYAGAASGPIAGRGVRVQMTHAGVNFYPLHSSSLHFATIGKRKPKPTGVIYATLFDGRPSPRRSFDFVLRSTGNDNGDGGLARGAAEVFQPVTADK